MPIPKPCNPIEAIIDQACGVKPEEYENEQKFNPADVVADVVDASIDWWTSKRPIRWSKKEHLENPTINCTNGKERVLAEKIAIIVKNGW